MILIYLAYIVGSLINTEESIIQDIEELGKRITGTGVEIIGSNKRGLSDRMGRALYRGDAEGSPDDDYVSYNQKP